MKPKKPKVLIAQVKGTKEAYCVSVTEESELGITGHYYVLFYSDGVRGSKSWTGLEGYFPFISYTFKPTRRKGFSES